MSVACAEVNGINLAQGVCDTHVPAPVAEAAINAIQQGHNIYTRLDGIAPLRQAIARKFASFNHLEVDPERQVLVTSGATGALHAALMALLNPGDECIVFEPFYGYHVATLNSLRMVPVIVPLAAPDWTLDLDRLRAAITPRTRGLILNTPPTPPARSSPAPSSSNWQRLHSSTTSSSSPTRCTRTSSTTAPSTSRSPPCPAWRSAPSRSPASARSSPSLAGASGTSPPTPLDTGDRLLSRPHLRLRARPTSIRGRRGPGPTAEDVLHRPDRGVPTQARHLLRRPHPRRPDAPHPHWRILRPRRRDPHPRPGRQSQGPQTPRRHRRGRRSGQRLLPHRPDHR